MPLKKGDFIEIDYIAKDKDTSSIVDLTSEEEAKKNNIHNKNTKYKPVIICIGENQILKGIDEFLINKEANKEYEIEILPEKAFGKKDPKLMKMMPTQEFKKQNINPFPGLQVRMDNIIGTIRTVSGGRTIVDFNHPLAGHTLIYKIKVNKIVKEDDKKIKSILSPISDDVKVFVKEEVAEIDLELPDAFQKEISNKIKQLIPKIKEIKFKNKLKNN